MAGDLIKVTEEVFKLREAIPYLWAIISALFGGVVFLFWRIFNGMDKKIDQKVSKDICAKEHEVIDGVLHTHAESGHAGEVVESFIHTQNRAMRGRWWINE